jgi:hypothetical protein
MSEQEDAGKTPEEKRMEGRNDIDFSICVANHVAAFALICERQGSDQTLLFCGLLMGAARFAGSSLAADGLNDDQIVSFWRELIVFPEIETAMLIAARSVREALKPESPNG